MDIEQVWAPQMLWYCGLVADRTKLLSALNQKQGEIWTSVTSYGELVCQIYDDLNALNQLSLVERSDLPCDLRSALVDFVRTLDVFDGDREGLDESELETAEWSAVERAANAVLDAAKTWNPNAQTH